jgi:DNA-binding NtrC family response regulator
MGKETKGITQETLNFLIAHHWPGNVRELRNVMERATIFAKGEFITPEDLPLELRSNSGETLVDTENIELWAEGIRPLAAIERDYIYKVLQKKNGNKSETAKILGISRSTLREKLNRYGK